MGGTDTRSASGKRAAVMPSTLSLLPQNGFSSVQPTPLQTTQAVEGKSLSVQWVS